MLETGKAGKVGRGKERVGGEDGTPLVDATIEFLREFAVKGEARNGISLLPNGAAWGKGKGKEKEKDGEEGDEEDAESFLPGYIYDALKGKKRFENMGVGVLSFLVGRLANLASVYAGWPTGRCGRISWLLP